MRVLLTGATGYIGEAVAQALQARGHHLIGLARSASTAAKLQARGITPIMGDFADVATLATTVTDAHADAVVSTASVGATAGDTARSFARDRDAIRALQRGLTSTEQMFVFTSGSAVFGVFNQGKATTTVYSESDTAPLPESTFAPKAADVPRLLAAGFGAAMAARVQTEHIVLNHRAGRGVVIRPGLVYGRGGSYDLPALIARSRVHGCGVHLGEGGTTQSFVHLDDLAELYCLALETAGAGDVLHGVTAEVTQRNLARAVSRMLGGEDTSDSLTLPSLVGLTKAELIGLSLTKAMTPAMRRKVSSMAKPSAAVGLGISLSLNKRLSADITRRLTGWSPTRTEIVGDIEHGSYANPI